MHITTYVKYISLACNLVYQRKTEPPKQNHIDRKELTFDDGRCYHSTTSPSLRSCGNANDLNVSSLQLRQSKNEEYLAFDNTLRATIGFMGNPISVASKTAAFWAKGPLTGLLCPHQPRYDHISPVNSQLITSQNGHVRHTYGRAGMSRFLEGQGH
ncbi:hypothetical protein PIB30_008838 [Stylosanthes scabra]|uniref:Uncharacterized protein n=1 Tax=Stylosanthes scabra TaxID=79078 RepID=A0ABU6Y309_9FABA|nr:hypothetical protein [Stylosanthes scabra]